MKRTTVLWALLGLSLVFNVFFVIGALDRDHRPRPAADIARVVADMDLDPQQQQRLEELRTGFRAEDTLIRQQVHEVKQAIAAELDADEVDADAMRDLMQQEADLIAARRATARSRFGQFIDLLTPEQRQELGRRMHTGTGLSPPPPAPPHLVAEFDRDGDGRLDESEREEARQSVAHRNERQGHWRAELRDKFDTNENGRLEPAEREAMRSWVLEQGFEPPPRGPEGGPPLGEHPPMGGPRRGGPRGLDGHPPRRRPGGPPRGPGDQPPHGDRPAPPPTAPPPE